MSTKLDVRLGLQTCKHCGVPMHYDFIIDEKPWKEAWKKVGVPWKDDGVLCAHCCLQALGLEIWEIKKSE